MKSLSPKVRDYEHLRTINGVCFTPREVDVIACFVGGQKSDKHIGQLLSISYRSVESHVSHILSKLQKISRHEITTLIASLPCHRDFSAFYRYHISLPYLWHHSLRALKETTSTKHSCFYILWDNHFEHDALELYRSLQHWIDKSRLTIQANDGFFGFQSEWGVFQNNQTWIITTPTTLSQSNQDPSCVVEKDHELVGSGVYAVFLSILRRIFPDLPWSSFSTRLNKTFHALPQDSVTYSPFIPTKERFFKNFSFVYSILGGFCVILLLVIIYFHRNNIAFALRQSSEIHEFPHIASPLIIPHDAVRLARIDFHHKLYESFLTERHPSHITIVGLVGLGGVGKTTIARTYASSCRVSVVWEINAATKESMIESLRDLGEVLASTQTQKEELAKILDTHPLNNRAGLLLTFVQRQLRCTPDWLLIYDNVDNFSDLQPFLPTDTATWGMGNIIITTRNSNIYHIPHIKTVIDVGELTPDESFELFTRILTYREHLALSPETEKCIRSFLSHIPCFPLDVAMAAHYIRDTHISFDEYLERINRNDDQFDQSQQAIWREVSDYVSTRYAIISVSIEKIISTNTDYRDLLALIAMIDTHGIHKSLLERIKKPVIVDQFIHDLRKYSMVAMDGTGNINMHRSTQAILLTYLQQNGSVCINDISNVLKSACKDSVEGYDYPRLYGLIRHIKSFLNSKHIKDYLKKELCCYLAVVMDHLSYYTDACPLLENNLQALSRSPEQAYFLLHLGHIYRKLGDFQKSRKSLEKGLAVCYASHLYPLSVHLTQSLAATLRWQGEFEQSRHVCQKSLSLLEKNNDSQNPSMISGLAMLGSLNREIGDYKEARQLIEQSLDLCSRHLSSEDIRSAWVLGHAGDLYFALGCFNQAKEMYRKSLDIYEKNLSSHHRLAGALCRLGNVLVETGELDKAVELIEKGVSLNASMFDENNIIMGFGWRDLSHLHTKRGDFNKALIFAEKTYYSHLRLYGPDNMKTNRALSHMGYVLFKKGQIRDAQKKLEHALEIWKKLNHPLMIQTLMHLGELYLSQNLHEQAQEHFHKALEIAEANLPPDSVYISQIKEAVKKMAR